MTGKPHQQKPDIDNLIKSVLDSLCENDAYIWQVSASKVWGDVGAIEIFDLSSWTTTKYPRRSWERDEGILLLSWETQSHEWESNPLSPAYETGERAMRSFVPENTYNLSCDIMAEYRTIDCTV